MAKKISSISLDSETIEWVEKQIAKKRLTPVSHACAYALQRLKEEDESVILEKV